MKRLRGAAATVLALLLPALALAGGWRSGGVSGISFNDPYTPGTGTFTVVGNVAFTGTTAPTGSTLGIGSDASSNLVVNFANGKLMTIENNGTQQWDFLGSNGNLRNHSASGSGLIDLSNNPVLTMNGATGNVFGAAATDAAGHIGGKFNNANTLTASSQALFDFYNNGLEAQRLTPNGGMVLSSSLTILSSGGFAVGTAVAWIDQTGILNLAGTTTPSGSVIGWGKVSGSSDMVGNVPTGRSLYLRQSGTTFAVVESAGAPTGAQGQFEASHFAGGSGVPTSATAGTGCGTASAPTVSGNDFMGTIGVTCGGAGTAGNNFVTATFAHAYVTNAPVCVFIPANANTDTSLVTSKEINNSTTTTLAVECGTGGTCPTGTLLWAYVCSQQ
jgi:hypothetical protein